jgi:sugar (pentulose or hexulose) kinase
LISTYLNYRLTGEFADSDASVVGHIPYNYKERNWDKPGGVKSKIFPADRSKLFEIRPSCSVIGRLTETAAKELHLPAGLPVAGAEATKRAKRSASAAPTIHAARFRLARRPPSKRRPLAITK